MDINETLKSRQSSNGEYAFLAIISQDLIMRMRCSTNWNLLECDQRESLEMIAHKIARILNGNPDTHDHWHDIAGYATLVANRLDK